MDDLGELRVAFATIVFCFSCYLVYDLFANGFSWLVLFMCLGGYVLVHFIWPKNSSVDGGWYDVLEFIVDLPFKTMALALRAFTRGSRGGDGDVGVDL